MSFLMPKINQSEYLSSLVGHKATNMIPLGITVLSHRFQLFPAASRFFASRSRRHVILGRSIFLSLSGFLIKARRRVIWCRLTCQRLTWRPEQATHASSRCVEWVEMDMFPSRCYLFPDIDECHEAAARICSNGQCVNTPGSFRCECYTGYELGPTADDCFGW